MKLLTVTFADGSVSQPLQQVPLETILDRRRASVASGQQVSRPVYALAGQNQLELWPEPGAGQSMSFWYVYLPDELTADGDNPAIMEPFGSELLEAGALVRGARFKKDPLLADLEADLEVRMQRFQVWLNRREGSGPRTFRVWSGGGTVRVADRSADMGA